MEKFYGIQYLRGFAAMYVMIFHLGSLCGVELTGTGGRTARLFFVISGFIITWTFRRTAEPVLLQLKRYAIRRAARIYPPYWVMLLVTLPLFLLGFGEGAWWHRDPLNIFQNFLLIQTPKNSIVFVAWTLVYEVFFYCLFGTAVILMGINVKILGVIWAAIILAYQALAPDKVPHFIIVSAYNLYFISGCFLAELHRTRPIRWPWPVFTTLLIAYILLPFWTEHEAPALILSWFLVTSSLGCFQGKPNKFFLLLGEASYSIYLCHGLTAIIIFRLTHGKIPYLVLVAVTFAVVMLFYKFVEYPLLNHFRTRKQKNVLTPGEIKIAPVP